MDKTMRLFLFAMIISGVVFAGCESAPEAKETVPAVVETEVEETAPAVVEVEVADPVPTLTPVVEKKEKVTVYKDGTYNQSGSYQSPAGAESVSVSMTVKGDVVTGVTVTPAAQNEVSKQFQGLFAAGINQLVVGKKLSEIGAFGQVNGSSLTPAGFNSAVAAMKAQAQND